MYKGPMDKPKGGRIEGGRWGWAGRGKAVAGKWRQLYLNNTKKRLKKKKRKNMGPLLPVPFPSSTISKQPVEKKKD